MDSFGKKSDPTDLDSLENSRKAIADAAQRENEENQALARAPTTMTVIIDGKEEQREYYIERNRVSLMDQVARKKPVLRDDEVLAEMVAGPPHIFKKNRPNKI
jgi:hypothetical protein